MVDNFREDFTDILGSINIQSQGLPRWLSGRESACNAENPISIPGSGRSLGEGIVYPLQYTWAFLVAQTVKNPPAVWETCVQSQGWEDPLEEGLATHSSIVAWRIHMDRGAWRAIVHSLKESDTTEPLSIHTHRKPYCIQEKQNKFLIIPCIYPFQTN